MLNFMINKIMFNFMIKYLNVNHITSKFINNIIYLIVHIYLLRLSKKITYLFSTTYRICCSFFFPSNT